MIKHASVYAVLLGFCAAGCKPIDTTQTAKQATDHSGLPLLNSELPSASEYLSGGDATTFIASKDAFSMRPDAIANDFKLDGAFTSGDHLFRTPLQGIGPLLNTSACQGCHLNDGRGVVPNSTTEPFTSMLVKIGNSAGLADPVYGDQIQTFSADSFLTSAPTAGLPEFNAGVDGKLRGEAYTYIEYEEVKGQYADGATYSLRHPTYKYKDLSYGGFMADIQFSPRVAPQIFGSGLLDAIPDNHIKALADPEDADRDGISGKVSWVTDASNKKRVIGRFAYKAQNPSVLQQVAGAFRGDSGLTSSIFPEETCTQHQAPCIDAAESETNSGDKVDLTDSILAFVEFYNRTLAVPARRGFNKNTQSWQPDVVAGRTLFMQIGCANCHTPRHVTGEASGSVLGEITLSGLTANAKPIEVLSHQTIYPYTDLLLHDMGGQCVVTRETTLAEACEEGKNCEYVQRCSGLADGLAQGDASASEWKTPALWGLGLVQTVNPNSTFLHDGRARNIEEAVLWHGGEAETSQSAFVNLDAKRREQVLTFLASL